MISNEDAEMLMGESQGELLDRLYTAYDLTNSLKAKINKLKKENVLLKNRIKMAEDYIIRLQEQLEWK